MYQFIYPYVHNYAKDKELLYSIRSLEKHFKEPFEIVLIGDKPDYLNDNVKFIKASVSSTIPVKDIEKKMNILIQNPNINDSFIWMNDDIYFINDIYYNDISSFKIQSLYDDLKHLKPSTSYRIKLLRTLKALKLGGYSTYNTATHLPYVYEKSKLDIILNQRKIVDRGYLISVYYNNVFNTTTPIILNKPNNIKLGLYGSSFNNSEDLKKAAINKKFFNHSDTAFEKAWNNDKTKNAIIDFLDYKFPNKSSYEK